MNVYVIFSISSLLFFTLTVCADTHEPLDGYEQVEPAAVLELPAAGASAYPAEKVQRGRYMTELLSCASCHTDGALVGKPDASRLLAGSGVGIARSNPMVEEKPGVVYPANLTPDQETGIGDWTLLEIVSMVQSGVNNHGRQTLPVMPWINYSQLQPEDATAIAMYLKSLPPVKHKVPANVVPGQQASAPFIHFGVYRSQQ